VRVVKKKKKRVFNPGCLYQEELESAGGGLGGSLMAGAWDFVWEELASARKEWAPEVPLKVRVKELWTNRLEAGVRTGSLEAVEEALMKGADVNHKEQAGRLGRSFILMAAEFGFLEILQRLLQADCVVVGEECRRGYSVLTIAMKMQHVGVVKWLMSDNGNRASNARSCLKVDSSGRPALSHAIPRVDGGEETEEDTEMMKVVVGLPIFLQKPSVQPVLRGLVSRWVETDSDGRGPLHWAASRQNIGAAKLCRMAGLQVEARDYDGNTALLAAAKDSRNDKMVEWLLKEAGADGLVKDNDGRGALALALRYGSANSVVQVLTAGLEQMATVDRTGKSGWDYLEIRGSQEEVDDPWIGARSEGSMGFHIGVGHGRTPLSKMRQLQKVHLFLPPPSLTNNLCCSTTFRHTFRHQSARR
jgi:ankyrin repeat protein